jgi:hypothetical protein
MQAKAEETWAGLCAATWVNQMENDLKPQQFAPGPQLWMWILLQSL